MLFILKTTLHLNDYRGDSDGLLVVDSDPINGFQVVAYRLDGLASAYLNGSVTLECIH